MPRSSPHAYLVLSWLRKQVSIPSVKYSCGFQSHHPLAAALPFRIWGVLSSAPCNDSRKHVPHFTGSWWSPGRHSPKRVASLYILQRSRSLHFWSQFSPCVVRQFPAQLQLHKVCCVPVCTAPSALSLHPFSLVASFSSLSACITSTTSLQTAWLLLPVSAHPYFKCSAQNILCNFFICRPSYDVLLLPVPPYLLPSFGCNL